MQYRLTSSQRIFYNKKFTLDSQIWNQGVMQIFPCVYSYEQLNNAYNKLVATHESLRVKLVETSDGVVADVKEHEYINYRFWQVETEDELMKKAQDFLNEPTDRYGLLVDCAVFQTPTTSGIMINAHHIVVDGFSAFVMSEHINSFLKDENFAPVVQKYADYVEKEEKYKNSRRYAKSQQFWLDEFSSKPQCNIFDTTENILDFTSAETNRTITAELFGKIKTLCDKYEITPASFFNAVNASYLYKKYELQNFTIGIPVINRTTADELNTIGLYMHLVPLVINITGDSFVDHAKGIEDSKMNLFRHQSFTQQDIKTVLNENGVSTNQLFDVVFDYQEFTHNDEYEMRIPYGNALSVPVEMHLQTFDEINHNLKIRYRTAYFSEQDIQIMLNSIFAIMHDALENPEKTINELEIITSEEKQKVLFDFNNTSESEIPEKSVLELIEAQVKASSDVVAVTACDRVLTYRQLWEESGRISAYLSEKEIRKGDIVAIKLTRKSYLLSVLIGILRTGAAYLPIDPDYPEDRIEYMITDSNAKFVVSEENVQELIAFKNNAEITADINPDDICYCIYTSGSTGKPKGTLITHGNVLNYVRETSRNVAGKLIPSDCRKILSVTTAGFDIFVTESILPLANGKEIILADEDESRQERKLSALVKKTGAEVIQTTPTKMKNLMGDYLKDMKVIILGGESLEKQLLKELKEKTEAKIYNIYGPTETTVWVTAEEMTEAEDIHIGRPISDTQIYIVDKNMTPVPVGVQGELCIAGKNVCAGYLNREELTNEKFVNNPFGAGKMYRTGDIAFWRADGNIGYVGRTDFQVKIRGQRIELGEIENAIAETEGIVHTVVVVRKDETGRQLICAFYTGKEKTSKEIKEKISGKLPAYMLPHVFTHLSEMPLTSSGKINRNALPEIDLENISTDTEYVAPETENEILLTECISKVLSKEKISVIDNFFDIGGDSLKAIELTSKLEEKGYTVTVKTIFSSKNIRDLAVCLEEKEVTEEIIEYGNVIPATPAQMRVYTAQMMKTDSTLYNITYAFRTENVDKSRLEKAINALIARHESLRTRFESIDGRIYQTIEEKCEISTEEITEENLCCFAKPFDLSKAPLIRTVCNENTVAVDVHHIVADGETVPVLFRELNELYMGREPGKTVQYGDFAVRNTDTSENEKYWLEVFRDEVPELNLPTDFQRKQTQSFEGTTHYSVIEKTLHEKIEEKCRQKGITPFVYYMACFSILLSKFSGNEDIIIGTPISGRTGRYLDTVGMFVNTIALRSRPEGNKRISDLLAEIRDNSIEAIDNQNYPFGELVKKIGIESGGRNPLFDVMMAYQSFEMTDICFADKKAELIPLATTSAKCDMTFNVLPRANDIVLAVEYCTDLFKEEKIQKFTEMYKEILEMCLEDQKCIKDISLADAKLIEVFNATSVSYEKDKCVHELFEDQVERNSDKTALVAADKTLTYRELNEDANKIANSLLTMGIGNGDIVAFRMSRKTSLVASMLGILKTGAAYLPIDPDYPEDRIEYMLSDSGAKYCITDENISALFENKNSENPGIAIDNSSVCYCIYTSGSTGKPKGTLLTHRNVVNYVSANEKNVCFGITKDSTRILSVTTAGFDIFVTETLLPLANGLEIILANEEQARFQSKLAEMLKNTPADIIQTTPTKMKSLMTDKNNLDYLKNFRAIILGGESLDTALVSELRNVTDAEIYNIYGPTEATVWATYAKVDSDNITIGKPMANTQIYITDKYMQLAPVGVTGELCIAGDCVAKGYLNRDELTNEKFIDNPFGEGKLYRTGDNAYLNSDGEIVFCGRNDFQVKIRGLRIELGEIENAIAEIDGIVHTVVVVRKDKNGRQLICAFYTGEEKTSKEIKEKISSKLPAYMIPHVFTHLPEMPLTSSGKINRNALPEVDLENIITSAEYVAPETQEEKIIAYSVKEILGADEVSMLDNFLDMGGDSLKAIELISKIEEKGYTVTVKKIFECENMQSLAKEFTEKEITEEKINYSNVIPATPAQMRVYTAQMMQPDSTAYNITYVFRTENIDKNRLEKAIRELVARHDSLRAHFENIDGKIHQVTDETVEFSVEEIYDAELNHFARPFNLSEAPLLRIGCNDQTIAVDLHHIIADGETIPVFFRELNELYMGRTLKNAVQYSEFASQQTDVQQSENYWLDVFRDDVPELNLPTDYTRGTVQSFNGTVQYNIIEKSIHEKIEEKCRQKGITPYVYYMTCLSILLSKISGSEDIVVGTPISGRTGRYLGTVGMFVNTIALRSRPEGNKRISDLLAEIRDCSIEAIDNQNYPFGELVKKLGIEAGGRNPLFDVMLAYQSFEMTDIVFSDKKVELIPLTTTSAKCDLTFNVLPRTEDVVLVAEYCTDLFKAETVQYISDMYKKILIFCLEDQKYIKDLSVTNEKILESFNDTEIPYETDKCVHELFEAQAEKTPDRIAISGCDKVLTYRELNDASNRIAHSIIEKGIGNGDIVAFRMSRKTSLVASMLGILKTGAAYLPIDPDYPEDRIEYMLSDSGAGYCITDENVSELLENKNSENPEVKIDNSSVCYCIYTSGSTGKPKGTLLTHRNVVNYVSANEKNVCFGITKDSSRILSVTTAGFDIFVTETLLPLANGMEIVLANEEQARFQSKLTELLKKNPADIIQTTPTKMKSLMTDKNNLDYLKDFRAIILGGEALDTALVSELKNVTDAEIYNIYGPTEATVWVTYAKIDSENITIGKPMANTQIYITDKYMKLVPVGVTGELCIAGDCVAKGYLNREDLTNERFVKNPFGEGKLYRTGDNAYLNSDGEIVFCGRNDFQVKIRGLRIELGEIENAIAETDGIVHTVVVVRKDKNGRQIICAFYTGEEKSSKEIKEKISGKLPAYMLPHVFTHLPEMPLTSSGKINRNALPEIDLENISTDTEYVAPETDNEILLTECISKVLGKERISVIDNFFDIGGDSLKSIELTSKLEENGYTVSVKTIFSSKNIRDLATYLEEKEDAEETIEYGNIIPATPAQMRVYTAQMMKPDSTLYNITYAFRTENADSVKLETAINALIARHEILRTRFDSIDGRIYQVIEDKCEISVETLTDENLYSFAKPVDLGRLPLIRVGCNDNTVVIDLHHIIADGESMPVFFKELNELYVGRELEATVQYGDFAMRNTDTQESEKYWLEVFRDEVPELNLPTDFQRKQTQSFEGTTHYSVIEKTLHEKIEEKCRQKGITPFVYYMVCFSILLSKFSGNEDIVIGTPISGRTGRYLDTVGMFVNTIALRSRPEGNKQISDLLAEIRDNSIEAIDNQNYPLGELVNKLNIHSKGRNPLFDVMMAYQSNEQTDITFGDKKAELFPIEATTAKCDINFNILPRTEDVVLAAEYCTDLYKEETILKFENSYKLILEQCLDDKKLIKDIIAVQEQEMHHVLYDLNNTAHMYEVSEDSTIYSLFEETAKNKKEKTCVIADGKSITFGELIALSESLDCRIREITEGKKAIIAVIAERSIEMYSAVYGIIRGGNAYMPIAPDYPADRIEYMLSNSNAAAVVAQGKFTHLAGNIPCIDMTEFIENYNDENISLPCAAEADDTAYVIYTSGSTGKPKGAKVSHRSAVNRILWMHDKYPLGNDDVILQKTPYTFDVSVWELFWWGMLGGSLAASKPNEHFLPAKIIDEVYNNKVTHLHFVPSVFELFLTYLEKHKDECYKFDSVKYVFLSGEALSASLVTRFYSMFDHRKVGLHNLYGPTECAVDVTYYDCKPDDVDPVPIGKPIYNTAIYIVDKHLNCVPQGVTGELCIGGVNVGQGYLNNPELTNEKFLKNPFADGMIYRTGDNAYIRDDGEIIFCGRIDHQIKLNGQRIEIGEIESVIGKIDGVESVSVIVKKINGRDVLVAFWCGVDVGEKAIRTVCEKELPVYMIPGAICRLDKLPLNPCGKLDRKALASIEVSENEKNQYEAPETEAEIFVAEAFGRVLDTDNVGRNSNFFEIGGSSLAMISLLSEDEFSHISSADFIANSTPAKLAMLMDKNNGSSEGYVRILKKAENCRKAVVLVPYAGGGAEAFAALVKSVSDMDDEISLYYVDYQRSYEDCKAVAEELKVIAETEKLYIYSHCAGSAVAMQIINILEEMRNGIVEAYISGASIPPEKPAATNFWDTVSDELLAGALMKAGAPLDNITQEQVDDMLVNFRKDTAFMTECFYKDRIRVKCPVSVIISKTDMFTENYQDAERIWSLYAENVKNIDFIETDTHYFQSDNSDEVARFIIEQTK